MKQYQVCVIAVCLVVALASFPMNRVQPAAAASYTNNTLVSPDGTKISSSVTVTETQLITDLNVSITFMMPSTASASCSDPGTGWTLNYYIEFRLTSPTGTSVMVVQGFPTDIWPGPPIFPTYDGYTPGGKVDIMFDDEAALIAHAPAPISGTFRPASPLAAFDGQNPAGVWTLHIGSWGSTPGLGACLFSFTLSFADPSPTPEVINTSDGRINATDKDRIPPFVVYCDGSTLKIYGINYATSTGALLLALSAAESDKIGIPEDVPIELANFGSTSFWRLPTGEFQGNGYTSDGKPYVLVWDGCPATSIYHLAN